MNAPQPIPVDISRALRAEIERRDWKRIHVEADRRPALQNFGIRDEALRRRVGV